MASSFQPGSPDYQQRVRESFHRQQVMNTIGAAILSIQPGELEIEFPYRPQLTQQHGFIHAGIVSTVIDSACGYAALTLMPAGAGVLTIEFKVNLLAPAKGQTFRAIGKVKKPGRNITVTEGELLAQEDGNMKLVATMVGTMMTLHDREGIKN